MGKYRSKEDKIKALVAWRRKLNRRCPIRAKYDQNPLEIKPGDHVIVWNDCRSYWQTPPVSPKEDCGCSGRHEPIPAFWQIRSIKNSSIRIERIDIPGIIFTMYQESIILNIGQYPPSHPAQDFHGLSKAQLKLITNMFFAPCFKCAGKIRCSIRNDERVWCDECWSKQP